MFDRSRGSSRPLPLDSPGVSFPGIVGIQVAHYSDCCSLPGDGLQDVCGSYYTGGMCQGGTREQGTLVSSSLSKGGRRVGNLRLLRDTTWSCASVGGLIATGRVSLINKCRPSLL